MEMSITMPIACLVLVGTIILLVKKYDTRTIFGPIRRGLILMKVRCRLVQLY